MGDVFSQKEGILTQPAAQTAPLFSTGALRRLILPLVVEQFLAITIGMADTVMVTWVGEAAVSGVSLVDSFNMLILYIFSALATGGAVVTAQYLGRQDPQAACRAAKQLMYAVTAVALALSVLCLLAGQRLLFLIFGSIEADVMDAALSYFLPTAASYPFLAIYNAGAALFRSMGNSKVSMLISLVMNLINVAGNGVFIFGFGMGAAGAGLGTLLSRAAAALLMLVLICQPTHPIHLQQLHRPQLEWGILRSILKVGIPTGLENGIFQTGKLLVASLVSSLGTAAIAANAISNTLAALPSIPGNAMGLALITVTGHCMGAGEPEQAQYYVKRLLRACYLCLSVTGVLLFLGAGPLVGLFALSPEAAEMAAEILAWYGVASALFWSPAFALPNALRAAGDSRFTMTVSILSMFLFRVLLSYGLVYGTSLGVLGVWLAMFADWICRQSCFLLRFFRGRWKSKRVID